MVDLVGNDGFEQEWLLAIYEEVEKDKGKQGEIERTREREWCVSVTALIFSDLIELSRK